MKSGKVFKVSCIQGVSQVLEAHFNALVHQYINQEPWKLVRFQLKEQYGLYLQSQHYSYSTGLFIIPLFRFPNAVVDID